MENLSLFSFILLTFVIGIKATSSASETLPFMRTSMPDPSFANAGPVVNVQPTDRQYDSLLARNKMMPLAAASYSSDANIQQCLTHMTAGARLQRHLTFSLPGQYLLFNSNTSGFTAVSPSDRAIIISIRGTDNNYSHTQIIEELNQVTNWMNFYNVGYVHKYFNDAFAFLWNLGMSNDFNTLKNQYPAATIAAAFIVLTDLYPANKIKLVTFGAPRPGNKEFADYIDSKISHFYRIVHAHDFGPHIPPPQIGYHHPATEIWYNNNMILGSGYYMCTGDPQTNVPASCSNSIPLLSISIGDHDWYFTHAIDGKGYGDAGCVANSTNTHNGTYLSLPDLDRLILQN